MAIFHLSAKPISRSAGRSATGAAAYRAGTEITDERTGQVHDYTRKAGVLHSEIILPQGGTAERSEFWNGIEKHHKRGDAVLSREVEISLPTELTKAERQALAVGFARELADRYGVAADVALHAPHTVTDRELEKNPDQYHETDPETGRRHNGNWHAHIMLSACRVSPTGELGKKAVELDPIHCQRAKIDNMADRERVRWAQLANGALERAGHSQRMDHRSHAERGIVQAPSKHLGPAAAGFERRTGEKSNKRLNWEQDIADRLIRAKELGELERQSRQLDRSILDLSGDLAAAKAERDRPPVRAAGIDPRSYYHPDKVAARQAAQPTPAPQVKRAAAAGVADLRTPFQRSRQEAAQQAAQPHQEDQDNQEKAERQRIERMSAAELRAEMARLRPPPLHEVVERQPELVTARQSSDTLAEQWRQAQAMAAQAGRELESWRSAHPVRAKAHDSGFMRAAVLVETEQRRQEAEAQWQRLAPRVEAATEQLKRIRSSTETRVRLEQAPALAKVAELERIERQRQAQEQVERAKTQALDEALSAFKGHALKRETKSLGYGDTGQQWNAIPEPLRKVIEDFNRLPKEARPVVLERMRENMQRDPQGVETFRQGLQPSRGNDRGMSR